MKRLFTLLTALSVCISLCACSTNQNDAKLIEEYKNRIAELEELLAMRDEEIDRLRGEEEDDTTENTEPENTEPQYTTVELTLENWDTYFEVVAIPVFTKNAFGEYDKFDLVYDFQLKETYYPLLNVEKTSIGIEISYNYGERLCTVDFENQTYELGERTRTCSTSEITDKFRDDGNRFYCSPFGVMVYDDGEVRYYEDVEMIRIQGSLCLKEE